MDSIIDKIEILSIEELGNFLKSIGPVKIMTPQFERTNGITPVIPDGGIKFFDMLKSLEPEILKAIGLQEWDKGHWLYPVEWYDFIPNGYIVTDINNEDEPFVHGETDDDIRFGCLAYGFKIKQ